MLTAEQARELFSYNPITGELRNRTTRNHRCKSGEIAGFIEATGYLAVKAMNGRHKAHRIILLMLTGFWPGEVDHINGDRADNRLINLREVTRAENTKNRRMNKNNSTGINGVSYRQDRERWAAIIGVNGVNICLYDGDNFFDACCSRKSAEIKYNFHRNHGEYVET